MKTILKTLMVNKLLSGLLFSAATLITFVACTRKPQSEEESGVGSFKDNSAHPENINI